MTPQLEQEQRDLIVKIAHEWLRTPYRHLAKVKGHGADCLTLLVGIFEEAGLVENIEIPYYPPDWHLHKTTERYLTGLMKYTHEVETPKPGDIVLWRFGHCYSHGALVINWPLIIHAHNGIVTQLEDAERAAWLTHIGEKTGNRERQKKFFSYWA